MAMKTKIIYEDDDLLVCHKPAGIATQSAKSYETDVVSECKNHIAKESGKKEPYLGIVHRLDQPVEGLLVFAKTKAAAAGLTMQLKENILNKKYRAIVCGIPGESEKTLINYLKKDATKAKTEVQSVAPMESSDWKRSELFYKVIETIDDFVIGGRSYGPSAVLDIEIKTGRFHQIRAQLSHMGTPIIGDTKYGNVDNRAPKLQLCAYSLTFVHPRTKEEKTFVI